MQGAPGQMVSAQTGRLLDSDPNSKDERLSTRQVAVVTAWGVALWLAAALFIRWAGTTPLFGRGAATAVLFLSAAPIGWLAVGATRRIASLARGQIVPGVAVACAAAMLCDGIGFTWTTLYGPQGANLVPPAAWLLWGVAWILIAAVESAARQRS